MADSEPELTGDQRQILLIVINYFRANQSWPTYRWLNQFTFVQLNLDLDDVFATIPPGFVLPEPVSWQARTPSADADVSLTLRGVASVGAEREVQLFLDTLVYIGEEAAGFIPSPEGTQDLTITSDQVAEAIKCQPDDPGLRLVRELITSSAWEIWSSAGATPEGHWQITVIPEKARVYRDITSIGALLRMREQLEERRHMWSVPTAPLRPTVPAGVPGREERSIAASEDSAKNTVFVVYGRNDAARVAMFDFLTSLGLEPLDWDTLLAATGEASPYVGEVLTAGFPMAQAVIVLLTPDDVARLQTTFQHSRDPAHETELTPQARPNVLFEAGMAFMSHPKRTVLVEVGQLRPFSDVAGRHTVRLDDSVEARRSLIARLQTAGCPVSLDDGRWKSAGDFSAALALANRGADPEVPEPAETPPATRFALVAETVSNEIGGSPVTLRVENAGPSDHFEATVVAIHPPQAVQPPWYVRWCNSAEQAKEILTAHIWRLEVCQDVVEAQSGSSESRGWRFTSPDSDKFLMPRAVSGQIEGWGPAIRVTVKVTPRSNPKEARENTVTLSLSERGRVAVWDRELVE